MAEFPRPDGLAAGPAAGPEGGTAVPGPAGPAGAAGAAGAATDDDADDTGSDPPTRFERIRSGTAAGVIMTGIALGFQEALTVRRNEPAIVHEAPGEPPGPPRAVELHVDPDDPSGSIAVVRPWLVGGDRTVGSAGTDDGGTTQT